MSDKFLKWEKQFFEHRLISDEVWLGKMLHENFTECGKSGYIETRDDVIESLLQCGRDRDIIIYNFEEKQLSDNSAVVHYYTKSDGGLIYRTSVWVRTDRWQLYFHQASVLNKEQADKIELTEY